MMVQGHYLNSRKKTSVGSNITPIIYFSGYNPKVGNRKVQKVNKLAFEKKPIQQKKIVT